MLPRKTGWDVRQGISALSLSKGEFQRNGSGVIKDGTSILPERASSLLGVFSAPGASRTIETGRRPCSRRLALKGDNY